MRRARQIGDDGTGMSLDRIGSGCIAVRPNGAVTWQPRPSPAIALGTGTQQRRSPERGQLLTLALFRKLRQAETNTRTGKFARGGVHPGIELEGSTEAIIGSRRASSIP